MFILKDFIRKISVESLERYCNKFEDINFKVNKNHSPEDRATNFAKYLEENPIIKKQVHSHFEEIKELSSGRASVLLKQKAEEKGFQIADEIVHAPEIDRSLWFFVEAKRLFYEVLFDYELENAKGWTSLQMQQENSKPNENLKEKLKTLSERVGEYYYKTELRGKMCKCEHFLKEGLHCFVAYPEDFAVRSPEYDEKGELNNEIFHTPIFKVLFIYDSKRKRISIKTNGSRTVKVNLGSIFASSIIAVDGISDEHLVRYNLQVLKKSDFNFLFNPDEGIQDVKLVGLGIKYTEENNKSLFLSIGNTNTKTTKTIRNFVEELGCDWNVIEITRAKIWVKFKTDIKRSKGTVTVNISDTQRSSTCNLSFKEHDRILSEHLYKWGIDDNEF